MNLVDPDGRFALGVIDPLFPPMILSSADFISLGAYSSLAMALFTNTAYYAAQAQAYMLGQAHS